MPGTDIQRQKVVSAFRKSELELGKQVASKLLWISALGCYRNPKMRHLAQNGKDRTPAKASSVEHSQAYLASTWKQVASYDQRNLGCDVLEWVGAI